MAAESHSRSRAALEDNVNAVRLADAVPVLINRFTPEASYIGRWVRVDGNSLGPAQCVKRLEEGVLVRYIDIPQVRHHEEVAPFGSLKLVRIPLGSRAWLPTGSFGWVAAEVTGWAGFDEYRVRISGQPRDLQLPSDRLVLRWSQPLAEPALALEHGFCDTPEYYEARRPFLDELVRQRRAGRGLTAVLSSSIHLFQHQIDTVARVLGDPVMRYLLADEVGLGKTIEAGLVIRQVLLDDSQARVVVVVPRELRQQWLSELCNRLLLDDDLKEGRLMLLSHAEATADGLPVPFDLVVVDEAHALLPLLDRRPFLRTQVAGARGLLLLSATPMRDNLVAFQRLLNLVDPTAFPIRDPDAFAVRVDEREQEASALDLLASRRATSRQKGSVLDRLNASHPDDDVVNALVQRCRPEVAGQVPGAATAELISYVRETYRISRRMIRHRRLTGPTRGYPVAGRRPVIVPFADPARTLIDDFLERFRLQSHSHCAPEVFAALVDHSLPGPQALLRHLEGELGARSALLASDEDRDLAQATVERMRYLGSAARIETAWSAAQQYLAQGQRVVVMAGSTSLASEFLVFARAQGPGRVLAHLADTPPDEVEEVMALFLDRAEPAMLLVGDRSLEEGQNLQDAVALVNLDLPLDLNRLEQRIGRLDRFATRRSPADVVVLAEPNSPWVSGHVRVLAEGVGVLSGSVATLQRRLALLNASLAEDLAKRGVTAFDMDLDVLRAELAYEREEVDLLEEVESVSTSVAFDAAAFAELEDYEADTGALRGAFDRLTSRRGGIGLPTQMDDRRGTFSLDSRATGRASNLSVDDLGDLLPLLRTERTFDRGTAASLRGVSLVRLGDPLVDRLDLLLRNDERGRARAWIRVAPGLHVPHVWFASDFLVEFDPAHIPVEVRGAERRLRRRGDALLPPTIIRTWTDVSGPAPEDLVAQQLSRPFDEREDQLLRGAAVWDELLQALPDWRETCRRAAEVAREHVVTSADFQQDVSRAVKRSRADAERRLQVLHSRSLRLPSEAEREGARVEMQRETDFVTALTCGVMKPAVVQIAAAAVVLWPASP